MIRKLFLVLICAVAALTGYAKRVDFDRLSDLDGVTEVYISKAMLSQMPDIETEGVDISGMAGKLDCVQILSAENEKATAAFRKDVAALPSDGYEEYMRIRDGGEKVLMYMKESKDGKSTFVMAVDNKQSYTLIVISGKFTAKDLQDLTKSK